MIKRYTLAESRLQETEDPSAPVVVSIAPDEAEKKWLQEQYRLDEHTLNSALDPDELSRLEIEPEYAAVIFKRPKNYSSQDNFLFRVDSTGMFLFKDRLVVVVREECPLFEGKPFARVNSLNEAALRLVLRAVMHFMNHLRVINDISGELERLINTSMENRYLLNMFTLEKSLVYYLNGIGSNATLIDRLRANAAKMGFTPDCVEFLDDLTIENNQCRQYAETYSQVLSSLMDARVSIVSNNLNQLIKTLTIITIAIMLPTLVVSIFSMNVRLPLDQKETIASFWIIMALVAISSLTVVLIWRRRGR